LAEYGKTAEPQLTFINRGLFSDHFLQERLPEWKEWNHFTPVWWETKSDPQLWCQIYLFGNHLVDSNRM